ncbi:MAG TPA: helix-turn-helix domain-containing protein [Chthoniobacterales bacterium]|nr:helix-turn-helix domain-containing protein [Chthoniobacterales bacterium]
MEGLGEKFTRARQERNLTLEEAARMTKIRPTKLAEIEAEDFSQFPSLAYAKGFILIYGKFLNVDVSPYLEAFETSEHVTVDGYSYLQDNPAPAPRRTEVVRKVPSGSKNSLLPLAIGVVILVVGFSVLKWVMNMRRINPSRDSQSLVQASPSPFASTTPGGIIAPRALAADSTPAPTPPAFAPAPAIAQASPSAPPTAAAASPAIPTPVTEIDEQEVRRAEPVHAEDLAKAQAALPSAPPSPSPDVNRFEVRSLRKTYVRVRVDDGERSSIERWVNASEGLQFRGRHIAVKVLDPSDVEIRKNGKVVSGGDADVRLE